MKREEEEKRGRREDEAMRIRESALRRAAGASVALRTGVLMSDAVLVTVPVGLQIH